MLLNFGFFFFFYLGTGFKCKYINADTPTCVSSFCYLSELMNSPPAKGIHPVQCSYSQVFCF